MSLTTRGTVTSQMQKWDTGTLAWVPWDGSVTGGTGGGTGGPDVQYVEDAVAPANPTGNALAMVRADTLSALTSTDGDIVAARGTDLGELYVNDATAHTSLASLDTKTPALGQALAAASTPVVLASDQGTLPVSLSYPTGTGVSTGALRIAMSTNSTILANQGNVAGSNPNGWWTRIGDGSTGPVAVKDVSTAAASTDRALVVRSVQLPAALGQTTMSASSPVTIASDQSALPISAASLTPQVATGTMAGTTPVVMVFNQPSPTTVVFINAVGHAITMNIVLQGSMNGVDWTTLWFEKASASTSNSEFANDIASTVALQDWGQYVVATGGMTHFRINPYNNPGGETPDYRIVAYPFSLARNAVSLAGGNGGLVLAAADKSLNVNLNTGIVPVSHGAGGELGNDTLRVSIADGNAPIGSVTETAPASDTASSGLNGRLQRIAQRLTSLIALLPTALGAGGGLKVDGSGTALPVSGPLTDTQLRATPVPISNGAVAQVSGTLLTDTLNNAVTMSGLANYGSVTTYIKFNGGIGGPVGVTREATLDGTVWFTTQAFYIQGVANTTVTYGAVSPSTTLYNTSDGWEEVVPVGYGITALRYRVSSTIAAGNTATIRMAANTATMPPGVVATLAAGSNAASVWTRIGDTSVGPVKVVNGNVLPSATFDAALVVTQRDSLPAGTNVIGHVITDSGSTTAVTGSVTTSPPANASTNVAQLAGTTTDTNSGNKSAGTLRVVLATDQPALTNKLLVTPDSVALPANQSVNVNQFGGTGVTIGQQLAAASLPVILPAATVTTLTPPAAITGFALDATLTGRTAKTQITDGTRDGTVKAASTLPALTDTAVVTTQRDPLPAGTNTLGSVKVTDGTTSVKVTVANAPPASTDGALLVNPVHTVSGTALASASRGVATVNTDIVNYNGKGIRVWQDLTVLGASSVCTFSVQEKDPVSGKFLTILASAATGAGINATGTAKLTVYPGLTAAANVTASDVLPVNIRIVSTVATAASTFSIGYSIIP
jgi:hypothetical protein